MVEISSSQIIIDRLRAAVDTSSDSELARRIGVSQQAISSARRGKIPDAWARIALSRFGISADWLYTGIGHMRFAADAAPSARQSILQERLDRAERLAAEREQRIQKLEAELEEARRVERRALLEANIALKRLLRVTSSGQDDNN